MDPITGFAIAAIALLIFYALAFKTVRISRWEQGALFVDGGFDRMLPPGRHRMLRMRESYVMRVSTEASFMSVGPVDAVTADGLPVRLNAVAVYRITDAEKSLQTPLAPMVHLTVSQALLKLAAGERLDVLLARSEPFDDLLLGAAEIVSDFVVLERIVLGAIVLPPELRRMITEVERARLEGLAALERARGEHASLRSLANAARMLKDNPELMNLRVLQALGSGGKGATLVLGDNALKARVD